MSTQISVNEVAPRDGVQSFPFTLSVAFRAGFVRELAAAGVRNVELTSFVNPRAVPQHNDPERLCEAVADLASDVLFSAYVPNSRGFERAFECPPIRKMGFAVGATDEMTLHNTRMKTQDAIDDVREPVREATRRGIKVMGAASAALGCPFVGPVPGAQVLRVVESLLEIGVDEIQIADTIGTGTPADVERLGAELLRQFPETEFSWHFHDTFGLGVANALAAASVGFASFDGSVGGVGGCPFAPGAAGNVASEELRRAFIGKHQLADEVDPVELAAIGRKVRDWVGEKALSKPARVGDVEWRDQFLPVSGNAW